VNTDKKVAKLKGLAKSHDVQPFCTLLAECLVENFDRWFVIAREQRLVEGLRKGFEIEAVGKDICSRSEFDASQRALFQSHVAVCLLAQRLYDWIDTETKLVSSEPISLEFFVDKIVSISEVVASSISRRVEKAIAEGPPLTSIRDFIGPENIVRETTDVCNILLSSKNPTRSATCKNTLSDNPEVDRLIQLARHYLEVKDIFDMYTYGSYRVISCDGKQSVHFEHVEPLMSVASSVASERNASDDNTRMQVALSLHQQIREALNVKSAPDFASFLKKQNSLAPILKKLSHAMKQDLLWEIREYFETSSVIDEENKITVEDLVNCWVSLRVYAVLASIWQNELDWEKLKKKPVIRLKRSVLLEVVRRGCGGDGKKARALLERFTVQEGKHPVDLFFTPIVSSKLEKPWIFASKFIEIGRFERNIFSILVADGVLDQDEKGFRPLTKLAQDFETAGFLVVENFPIVDSAGNLITDADIVAYKEGILFVGQAKVVIEPDTVYERWKARKRLEHAAVQLHKSVTHADAIAKSLAEKFPDADINMDKVRGFIVTNTRQYTELSIGGFPVVDLPYLTFVLSGATATHILRGEDGKIGVSSGKSFIAGTYPTAAELYLLVEDTLHQIKGRLKEVREELITVDSFSLTIPSIGMSASPHPFMKILTEEEADRFLKEDAFAIAIA